LNSSAGVEQAIQKSETQSLTGIWPALGPETILLVEDEAFVREAAAEALESAGYRLLIAGSAAEALAAYRGCFRPVDLLLADVVMPGMSGRDLAAEFAGLCPRTRILLMSGYAEQLAACQPSPYKKWLAKPFSTRTLLRAVREALNTNPFDEAHP
jgi:two-component system, cell cycle sensor histidine kinase and response regulator CckA